MTETHTPEPTSPKPTPTHIVEVYLQDGQTLASCARTERYFYADERAAEGAYVLFADHLKEAVSRDRNGDLMTLETHDLYGRGTLLVRDLRGVRLLDSASLDDFAIGRDARIAGAQAAAKHAATVA